MKTKLCDRVGGLDELRGVSIILMVVYHFCYDLVAIFDVYFPIFFSAPVNILRDIFAGVFIVISGICCNYSENNLKRGVKVLGCGVLLTLITAVFIPQEIIWFGILHMLGTCMIIYPLVYKITRRIKPYILIAVYLLLFCVTFNLENGYIAFINLPQSFYGFGFLFPIGLPSASFFSSDYFPLFPWMFLFFAGCAAGVYIKAGKAPDCLYKTHIKPFAYAGRHTLAVYLLHQPIIFGILQMIFYFSERV